MNGQATERRFSFDALSPCARSFRFCYLFACSRCVSFSPFPSRSLTPLVHRGLTTRTNENGMNAITSRHCRLFCERYYLPVFARVIVVVAFSFSSLPYSSPYLLCLHVAFYLVWRLFRRCSPNNDFVRLAVTHAGIFARISLVRAFSLCQDRGRFQEGERYGR